MYVEDVLFCWKLADAHSNRPSSLSFSFSPSIVSQAWPSYFLCNRRNMSAKACETHGPVKKACFKFDWLAWKYVTNSLLLCSAEREVAKAEWSLRIGNLCEIRTLWLRIRSPCAHVLWGNLNHNIVLIIFCRSPPAWTPGRIMQRALLTPSPTSSESSDDDGKHNKGLDLLIEAANYLENCDNKRQRGNVTDIALHTLID